MPTFSTEEVARLAALARIDLTPQELSRFAGVESEKWRTLIKTANIKAT